MNSKDNHFDSDTNYQNMRYPKISSKRFTNFNLEINTTINANFPSSKEYTSQALKRLDNKVFKIVSDNIKSMNRNKNKKNDRLNDYLIDGSKGVKRYRVTWGDDPIYTNMEPITTGDTCTKSKLQINHLT